MVIEIKREPISSRQGRGLFLALTLIAIMVIVIIYWDITLIFLIIWLILAFATVIIYDVELLGSSLYGHKSGRLSFENLIKKEDTSSPESRLFHAKNKVSESDFSSYPGAINFEEERILKSDSSVPNDFSKVSLKNNRDQYNSRAILGSMNRIKNLDPYLRQELDEAEKERWWGEFDP